jgi:hypothetical protein
MVWLRADGVAPGADPVLNQQFEMDRTICNGDMQKANLSGVTFAGGGLVGVAAANNRNAAMGQVGQGCMAEKGYVIVRVDQAGAKSQELEPLLLRKHAAKRQPLRLLRRLHRRSMSRRSQSPGRNPPRRLRRQCLRRKRRTDVSSRGAGCDAPRHQSRSTVIAYCGFAFGLTIM